MEVSQRAGHACARQMDIAVARPRSCERSTAEGECLEIALHRERGRRVLADESQHRQRTVERDDRLRQQARVPSGSATEIHARSRGNGSQLARELSAIGLAYA